eukprot:GHVU01093310.1.p1 GENE.GHVU01093310.1~~GHVU01093310.1.p1  ORF type:complete len:216 (+),score=6.16 GHVU01093310.1:254-901(+)
MIQVEAQYRSSGICRPTLSLSSSPSSRSSYASNASSSPTASSTPNSSGCPTTSSPASSAAPFATVATYPVAYSTSDCYESSPSSPSFAVANTARHTATPTPVVAALRQRIKCAIDWLAANPGNGTITFNRCGTPVGDEAIIKCFEVFDSGYPGVRWETNPNARWVARGPTSCGSQTQTARYFTVIGHGFEVSWGLNENVNIASIYFAVAIMFMPT